MRNERTELDKYLVYFSKHVRSFKRGALHGNRGILKFPESSLHASDIFERIV